MKNDFVKKGDWVIGIIERFFIRYVIDRPLKVCAKLYDGIIVEIPDGFSPPYIVPWKGSCQIKSLLRECNLSPDRFYYFFDNWKVIRSKKEKMKI